MEIYRTHEMGDCVTMFRDTLYACSTSDKPNKYRHACDPQLLHFLLFRLSNDARKPLTRIWDKHPEEFVDDSFGSELCGLKSLKPPDEQPAS